MAVTCCCPTRHPGYVLSQRLRKRVEEILGWLKTVGGMRKIRFRGKARVGFRDYGNSGYRDDNIGFRVVGVVPSP